MLQKQRNHQTSWHFHRLICLVASTLAFTVNGRCQAFVMAKASAEPSGSVSSLHTTLTPANPVIAQGIIEFPRTPSTFNSPAIIILPGISAPTPVNPPPEVPPAEVPPAELPPVDDPFPPVDESPPPFSLKDVRQSINLTLPSATEIPLLPELAFDRMYPGVAGQADLEVDGRRVDFYQFEGEENQQIVVVLRNSADARQNGSPLMPYMIVFDSTGKAMAGTIIPGQHRIATDDPLLPLDNQLALRLPKSGRYVVAVFTDPGQVGRYGIGWKQDETHYRYDQTLELTGVESEPAEMTGEAGQVVRIQATSYQFDPVVMLMDANGDIVAENDDDGGNYNAKLVVTLPADGIYRAVVTSADGQGQGLYRLMMR